jgi:hypothetical protein
MEDLSKAIRALWRVVILVVEDAIAESIEAIKESISTLLK